MQIQIRPEQSNDFPIIFQVVKDAFAEMPFSNQSEHFLVEKLRKTDAYIPELALVAELEGKIVGYIILTIIHIDNGEKLINGLSLGPVAVIPALHGQGIGSQLIREVHKRAKSLGHEIVILLGHKDYYPRFGYEKMNKYGIKLPFDSHEDNCMVLGLTVHALEGVSGDVIYSKPFLEG